MNTTSVQSETELLNLSVKGQGHVCHGEEECPLHPLHR